MVTVDPVSAFSEEMIERISLTLSTMRVPKESISLPPKTLSGSESSALTGISKLPDKLIMMLDLSKVINGMTTVRPGQSDVSSLTAPTEQMKAAEVSR